jgi:hypothetical protein
MPRVEFEPATIAFERPKTVRVSDFPGTVMEIVIIISYHMFSFPWYFSPWTYSAPHYPGFKFQFVTLPSLRAMTLVRLFIAENQVILFWYCFQIFFSLLFVIPLAPEFAGMMKHFIFHIRWIPTITFLYFNFFSASFYITFLSDGIATSINNQILPDLFLIMPGLLTRTCLYPFIP